MNGKVSGCAFEGGDEAKVVELPDGRVLPGGTIGMYYEENPSVEFDMIFANYSANWLLNGQKKVISR